MSELQETRVQRTEKGNNRERTKDDNEKCGIPSSEILNVTVKSAIYILNLFFLSL